MFSQIRSSCSVLPSFIFHGDRYIVCSVLITTHNSLLDGATDVCAFLNTHHEGRARSRKSDHLFTGELLLLRCCFILACRSRRMYLYIICTGISIALLDSSARALSSSTRRRMSESEHQCADRMTHMTESCAIAHLSSNTTR